MSDLTDISKPYITLINQFDKEIYSRAFQENPFSALVPTMPFDNEMGLTPQVITATHDLPTSYPDALTSLSLSNGTGNTSCLPATTTIGSGTKVRNFTLKQVAFKTNAFCLTDLNFSFQVAQMVRAQEKGLGDYVVRWQADWHRVHNIGMIETKVSTGTAGALDFATNDLFTFAAVDAPTAKLSWDHLSYLYDKLAFRGAAKYSIGYAGGAPTYALVVGPTVKRDLFKDTTITHTDVNYSTMGQGIEANGNFLSRGITQAINGFVPVLDETPIRYAADGTTKIYPYKNDTQTSGTGNAENPDYAPISRGGLAKYETFVVMARNVYSRRPRSLDVTSFGQQSYSPVNYAGVVNFINNKDMTENPLGNMGYYRIDIQQAAMPEFPEFGFTGITLIPGETA